MNLIGVALAILLTTVSCFSQGQILFANKFGTSLDAPVFALGTQHGPGPDYTVQLAFQRPNGSVTPVLPTSTFQAAGSGVDAMADRYWESKLVEVPLNPGESWNFVVRAWRTSLGGTFEDAIANGADAGASDPFTVTVGGGSLPPAVLINLKSFSVGILPEPSIVVIGLLGAVALLFSRRR
jgi:hypothetical protein